MVHTNTLHVNTQSSISLNKLNPALTLFRRLSRSETRVARHILYYGQKLWGYCSKKYKTIANELNVSYSTVFRAIQKLKNNFIECYRMGNQASKIYASDLLKAAFSNTFLPNDSSVTVLPPPTLYNKKEKLNGTIEAPSSASKAKDRFANVLFSLGLSLKEVKIFLKLKKKRKISYETFQEAANDFRQYASKNPVATPGGLFRRILEKKHSRAISIAEEKKSAELQSSPPVPDISIVPLMKQAFDGKVLSADGFVNAISATPQVPQGSEIENVSTGYISKMRKMFNL